ncbi:pyridoxal-dependent decarboxylase conserved domain protein [Apiospora marii]|uniref:pyridoxal-dependent decarboxylase conserved domain protein n=1 Tax=Apiospora marii TaxID=335849 RepID=UPI00313090AC
MGSTKDDYNEPGRSRDRSENNVYHTTASHEDKSHQVISSYFIGPQAENLGYFKENIHAILDELEKARHAYFPEDGRFISHRTQQTEGFIRSKDKLKNAVRKVSNIIARASIPFWSPRYQAHIMASLLGYFMTMLYNPNNVAIEASPVSTVAEIEVGEQLCELFGYNTQEDNPEAPTAWGHTQARNLKFYPPALRKAFDPDQKLHFLSEEFHVETCKGERKLFARLSNWELLNLKPSDILDLPDRLYQEHGVSNAFLSEIMKKFTIQSTGKDELERELGLTKPCQYMLANTRHYSWPKGAAICGLGSDNVVGIPVDLEARLDLDELEKRLRRNLEEKQPVLAVVGIMGSTEEGAVDRLRGILALRKQFQTEGLSFLIHADAAWGGYFCSMLPRNYQPGDRTNLPTELGAGDGFVPDASLRVETQEDLYAMRFVDSITVDPHKAGYIPYPASGLCYRDGRMRFLVTWTAPVLSRGSVTSIGIYGVEGSKPGAAAMSTWLANKTIGLNPEGYGALLGEVTWTCTRLSAEWASLTNSQSPFHCVPFNMLPSELSKHTSEEKVQAEKARIRTDIITKTNAEIVAEDRHRRDEDKAMRLMRALGSDLNINAFALNFRHEDGTLNDDLEEANYLMQRVVGALSVESPDDRPADIPLFLTSTEFSDELYGECKKHFVRRLGLAPSAQDLMVLRNVVMSPFPTDQNFIRKLATTFYDVVAKETEVVRQRNKTAPVVHRFLIQGITKIYLVHLPMFHEANHRQQLIVAARFDAAAKAKYDAMKRANPTEPLILVTKQKVLLRDVVERSGRLQGQIMTNASYVSHSDRPNTQQEHMCSSQEQTLMKRMDSGIVLQDLEVSLETKIVSRPLNSKWRLEKYPDTYMPFYLYGTASEAYIDHIIVRAPNTQLSAGRCKLDFYQEVAEDIWEHNLVLLMENVREEPMQPFPPNSEIGSKNGAIVAHESYRVDTEKAATQKINPKNGLPAPKHDPYKDSITRPRGEPNGIQPDGNGHRTQAHEEDGAPRPHTAARVVTSETRSGSARGSQFFFRPGAIFKKLATPENFVGRGTLTLGDSVFVDSEAMNADRFRKVENINEWRHEFNQIGKEMV